MGARRGLRGAAAVIVAVALSGALVDLREPGAALGPAGARRASPRVTEGLPWALPPVAVPGPDPRDYREPSRPVPVPTPVPAKAHGKPKGGTPVVTGAATWYRRAPGGAAAGPGLRRALGPGWRGRVVTVCASRCVRVRLDDWCLCSGGGRLVDLAAADFARIAPLSAGVVRVHVGY